MNNSLGVIVVAAGKGTRMGTAESKQYLLLQNKPILVHTLERFNSLSLVEQIVLVTGAEDVARCENWAQQYGLQKVTAVIAGGSERQYSVQKGLDAIRTEWVMVHDGVRPFVGEQDIQACYQEALKTGAAVLAVPVKDTIKQVNASGTIVATPDRQSLWAIQTPQTFRHADLVRAHEEANQSGFVGTDDAMLVERLGVPVNVVQGSYSNIKITTPEDLAYGEFLAISKGEMRL